MAIEINSCLLEDILAVTNMVKRIMGIEVCIYFFILLQRKVSVDCISSRVCVKLNSNVLEMSDRCHFNGTPVPYIHTICLALFR